MTSFNFKDITLYFTSPCCHSSETNINNALVNDNCVDSLVRTMPKLRFNPSIHKYLVHMSTANTCHASTITIGNKYYGRLSAKTQYKHFKKQIKAYYPYRGKCKYIFTFEYQLNGQLHAHGYIIGGWQATHIEAFSRFGKRNTHDDSYQTMKHPDKYATYINKDPVFPYVTNIMNKDISCCSKKSSTLSSSPNESGG